jgi:hypothetical protein
MTRRLVGAFAFAMLVTVATARTVGADTPSTSGATEPPRAGAMQFTLWQEGPASSCRDKCRTWVSAVGMIRADTVRDFEAFADANDINGATLVIDSEGGSVVGALALGRAVRRFGMTTTVGKTTELRQSRPDDRRAMLSPRADCESMCAFLMLAGTKRIVPTEARVRVHQIWLGDRREDANAATYSAEDLVLVQRDIGKLAAYTMEMGGSAELLELSLRIPPWEPMHSLTRDELRRMKIDTENVREAAVAPSVAPAAPERAPQDTRSVATNSAPPVANIRRIAPAGNERGWTLVRQGDATMLVRRHPLTVEGENIGTFDVMLTCGATPAEFSVLYNETRKVRDQSSDPVDLVDISVGSKAVALAMESSEITTPKLDRETYAAGILPASQVKTFAEAGAHSMTISTSSGRGPSTMVRVGNSGAAQYFPQLIRACAQPRGKQAALQQ